ncbi:MAG TPA: serine/threonine-protein kinase [Planctomycetota bacterium]|nr:serine/threonine-protein kinase [Planctomycetota bacterium]
MTAHAVSEAPRPKIDWEAFYRNYRKPGYVPGYEIINKLGGGVFGMVFKARKESIGKDYAIKFLKVDDEVVRDAVVRELDSVRYFAQVDHPNLVSIEDKGEVDGIPYIIMSYAGDDTLRKRLDAGRLSRDQALRYFLQAARGVQALHERSLVHFDLKPANIFLKGDIARVGDYGLSKLVTESRNSLSFGRGTPYYMAPEMLQRRGDQQSDIYSLGVILYECLTGDVPFRGDSEWEVLKKHETATPNYPDSITPDERRILERCLAKRPEDRFASVRDLLHAFDAPASLGESMFIPQARPAPASEPRPAPPAQPAPEPAPRRNGDSPYGLPWSAPEEEHGGVLASAVHAVFRLFEFAIFLALVPVRLVGVLFGRALPALLLLPFQIVGLSFRLLGYLVVAVLLLFVLVSVIAMVTRVAF